MLVESEWEEQGRAEGATEGGIPDSLPYGSLSLPAASAPQHPFAWVSEDEGELSRREMVL